MGTIDLKWRVDIKESKVEGEGKSRKLIIEGTALAVGKSKNNRNYRVQNLEENDGKPFNFIVGHQEDYDNPNHNVGEGAYALDSESLNLKGWVKNTIKHPDIIEQIQDGLVGPSVQGGATVERVEEDNEVTFNMEKLHIPLVALVNKHTRGVEAASLQAAVSESFKEVEENDKQIKTKGDKKMSEIKEADYLKLKEENENLKKKAELDKKKAEEEKMKLELEKKKKLVESILLIKKGLDKNELMEKSDVELNIIESYEKKIKESDETNKEEGSTAEVPPEKEAEADKPEEKVDESMRIDKKDKTIGFNDKGYKAFNKSIMESAYR